MLSTSPGQVQLTRLESFLAPEPSNLRIQGLESFSASTLLARKLLPSVALWPKKNFGRLTQRLECHLHTVEVGGSNPLPPTRKTRGGACSAPFVFSPDHPYGFRDAALSCKSCSSTRKFPPTPGTSPGSAPPRPPRCTSSSPWASARRFPHWSWPGTDRWQCRWRSS